MDYVRQFAIDVFDCDDDLSEEKIMNALEKAGIPTLGCCWKATWTVDGYNKSEPPISSD